MKAAPVICLVVLLAQGASAQTVSYWFQGWQSKPDAKQAAAYFMVPGVNVTFTYQTNRVIINSGGGGGGGNLQLFGDVTSPLTALPNVTATLKNTGTAGTYVKTTFDAQGRETSGVTTLGNADLVNSSVTYNGVTVSLGASGTLLLSGVGGDFLNEGTTTTVLHGNAAGTLSFGAVDLANDVTGNLGVTHLNSGIGAAVGTFWQGDGTWAVPTTIPTGLVTNQFTTNPAVNISQFQPSCINLTQWCGVSTNDFFLSVTQYVRDATNGLGGTGVIGLVTNEFTTNPAVAISQFQPACVNLSNWCLLSTNYIVDLITNDVFYATNTASSNILTTVSNSIYTTSNSLQLLGVPNVVFNNAGTTNYAGFGAAAGNVAGGGNTAVGYQADAQGATFGAGSAFGYQAEGHDAGTAVGYQANATSIGTAVGVQANGSSDGVAVGYTAAGSTKGVGVGREASGGPQGVAVGYQANGTSFGVGVGYQANGTDSGSAIGLLTDAAHHGVAVGANAIAEGKGSVALGGDDTGANKAQVTIGWLDTVELGRGSASIQGGLNFRGFGLMNSGFAAFATNYTTTAIKWIDIPMNYAFSIAGANAPTLGPVTNASVINALLFKNTSELFAQCQLPHTVAITNAAYPAQYIEPHVHFDTIGTLGANNTNVTWRIEWQVADIGGTWRSGTNFSTNVIAANYTHYLAEFGHLTNNPPLNISAVFRCRLMRPNLTAGEYSPTTATADVVMDAFDLHVPIGNTNAIGSTTETAP